MSQSRRDFLRSLGLLAVAPFVPKMLGKRIALGDKPPPIPPSGTNQTITAWWPVPPAIQIKSLERGLLQYLLDRGLVHSPGPIFKDSHGYLHDMRSYSMKVQFSSSIFDIMSVDQVVQDMGAIIFEELQQWVKPTHAFQVNLLPFIDQNATTPRYRVVFRGRRIDEGPDGRVREEPPGGGQGHPHPPH